jgi:hypothetical protein
MVKIATEVHQVILLRVSLAQENNKIVILKAKHWNDLSRPNHILTASLIKL